MAANPLPLFTVTPVPPEDWLRISVTLLFSVALIAFPGLYLYFGVTVRDNDGWARTKEAFSVILPSLTGILDTVIGFYFGKGK